MRSTLAADALTALSRQNPVAAGFLVLQPFFFVIPKRMLTRLLREQE